jgi:hypothetical protein
MHRRLFADLASMLALALAGCGTEPAAQPQNTAGTQSATSGSGAGGQTGGGATSLGGTSGGLPGTAGTVGSGTAGSSSGGAGGSGVVAPACAPVTQLNGAGLTLKRSDVSAFKFATVPAGNMVKMDYDPVTKQLVMMNQAGKFWKMDPATALPTSASNAAVTTPMPTEADYGFTGDHRGMVFGPDGTLYTLAASGGPIGVTIRKGVAASPGGARTWSTIATSDTYEAGGTNFDHSYSGMAISPDGMFLFFSSGSRTDHGEVEKGAREVPLTSAVFKIPTTGTSVLKNDEAMLQADGFLFADGTRNAFDMAFNAEGDLIAADNGPDMDLPDEVNFLEQGKHYGFPWRFAAEDNPVRDPAYTPQGDMRLHAGYQAVDLGTYTADATFPAAPAGVTFVDPIKNLGPDADKFRMGKTGAPTDASDAQMGLAGITGHRSPLGIAFDVKGASCGDYYKQGLLLSYGAVQDVFNDKGEDLLLLQLIKVSGAYTMKVSQIATGIKAPMDGVMVGNSFFSLGFGGGNSVYVIVLPKP